MHKMTLARTRLVTAAPVLLVLTGLILMSIGIGMIYPPVGWIAAGIGAFYLESRTGGG